MRCVFLVLLSLSASAAQEVRPGIWGANDVASLPIPASGYQVYLMGEMHGVREMEAIFSDYLLKLNQATGLRDVAIEEKAAFESGAQAYVEGTSDRLPSEICLRAGFLIAVRRINQGRTADRQIRVHLVDLDSSADSIRRHLLLIREKVTGAAGVRVPDVAGVKSHALETVAELKKLPMSASVSGELRTVEHSIRALLLGFEIGTGQFQGSSYLEDREQAIASNLQDLANDPSARGVFAIYGSDHVSKTLRKDGGPNRDAVFAPMALRLQEAGVKVFSLIVFPLAGRYAWRGQAGSMPYTAEDGHLANGETLDKVLAAAHQPKLLYVDTKREKITVPSDDVTRYHPEGFLLISAATAMENRCAAN